MHTIRDYAQLLYSNVIFDIFKLCLFSVFRLLLLYLLKKEAIWCGQPLERCVLTV